MAEKKATSARGNSVKGGATKGAGKSSTPAKSPNVGKPPATKNTGKAPVESKVPAAPKSAAKIPAAPKSAAKIPTPPKSSTSLQANITVGCAGFPVPATRYFKEFNFVEVQDTHVSLPGMGTLRRWRREAPPGFRFTLVAPRESGLDGFKNGKPAEVSLQGLADIGKELDSDTVVILAPPDFAASRSNRTIAKDFLQFAKKRFKTVIWEAPHWPVKESEEIAEEAGAIAARDPLTTGTSTLAIAYYRMPGPAGHKSRYEDHAIDRLAELVRKATNKEATYVFTNVDMFADAKRLKKLLKLP